MTLEKKLIDFVHRECAQNGDAAHDIGHLKRVAAACKRIHAAEGGNLQVLLVASYFHDIVSLAKNDPQRHLSSQLAAQKTVQLLNRHFSEIPAAWYQWIAETISSHSYSANIPPQSLEARILQDADRLDAIGAIGLARVFYTAGKLSQKLFDEADPFASQRQLDEKRFALDHFKGKLLNLSHGMHTAEGRRIARERTTYLIEYLQRLADELGMAGAEEAFLSP